MWSKGQSGNPKGRPTKGETIAARIATLTRNGQRPLKLLDDVTRGHVTIQRKDPQTGERMEIILTPKISEMIQAAELLMAYQHGKPIQAVITVDATPEQQTLRALVDRLGAWESGQVVEGQTVPALEMPQNRSTLAAQPPGASNPSYTPLSQSAPVSDNPGAIGGLPAAPVDTDDTP